MNSAADAFPGPRITGGKRVLHRATLCPSRLEHLKVVDYFQIRQERLKRRVAKRQARKFHCVAIDVLNHRLFRTDDDFGEKSQPPRVAPEKHDNRLNFTRLVIEFNRHFRTLLTHLPARGDAPRADDFAPTQKEDFNVHINAGADVIGNHRHHFPHPERVR